MSYVFANKLVIYIYIYIYIKITCRVVLHKELLIESWDILNQIIYLEEWEKGPQITAV